MKYIMVLADGMADYPIEQLGGATPLERAHTPNLDRLAGIGRMGMAKTIPDGMPPGSDVANLSVIGYDPKAYYTGRSPLEAVSLGVEMADDDVAFRCNLVTLSQEDDYARKTMVDYSSDEISTEESRQLMAEVDRRFGSSSLNFYPGISYRHLLVWRSGSLEVTLTPPHDISGRVVGEYLPAGKEGGRLLEMMEKSPSFLAAHPVNREREKRGLHPANSIWFWGEGKRPALSSFVEKYGIQGSVVCAVDLIRGLGICAGLRPVRVDGATGGIVTDFWGKARAAVDELKSGQQFVFIHIEAPDEAGHHGDLEAKIRAIEEIDSKVIGQIIGSLGDEDYRLMILPDHPTPISLRTHVADEVPFLLYEHRGGEAVPDQKSSAGFGETAAGAAGWRIGHGHELMDVLILGG
ncbi:MAG: cofactor-independent phosphoglycerate mutase [Firmicutes bacterium]|nr:cofactor-independent phosphoglycerate mutase [Bacillota bacterium]